MTLNIRQLLEDAKMIQQALEDYEDWFPIEARSGELQAIDRIIAYFEERYVPPSEPGSYREARGILASGVNIDTVFEGGTTCDEPAEASIRRVRDE